MFKFKHWLCNRKVSAYITGSDEWSGLTDFTSWYILKNTHDGYVVPETYAFDLLFCLDEEYDLKSVSGVTFEDVAFIKSYIDTLFNYNVKDRDGYLLICEGDTKRELKYDEQKGVFYA